MNHKFSIALLISTIVFNLFVACSQPTVPAESTSVNTLPDIYPDYVNVTVPCNICPMNFYVKGCDEAVARLSAGQLSYTYGEGTDIIIPEGGKNMVAMEMVMERIRGYLRGGK